MGSSPCAPAVPRSKAQRARLHGRPGGESSPMSTAPPSVIRLLSAPGGFSSPRLRRPSICRVPPSSPPWGPGASPDPIPQPGCVGDGRAGAASGSLHLPQLLWRQPLLCRGAVGGSRAASHAAASLQSPPPPTKTRARCAAPRLRARGSPHPRGCLSPSPSGSGRAGAPRVRLLARGPVPHSAQTPINNGRLQPAAAAERRLRLVCSVELSFHEPAGC